MAKFRIVILPAKMLIGGKHKLRIAISHNSDTRYIPTQYIVDSEKNLTKVKLKVTVQSVNSKVMEHVE